MKYLEESPDDWSEKVAGTFSVTQIGTGVTLSGNCPVCGHLTSTAVDSVMVVGGIGTKGSSAPEGSETVVEVVVICGCSMDHENRPAAKRGCGRFGHVELVGD